MEEKKDFYKTAEEICGEDSRYRADAYEFVMQALHFTQKKLKKNTHVSGRELAEGARDFAIEQYGPLARTVLSHWGIKNTDDFGNIVFNMIAKKIFSKTDEDSIADFKDVYDFSAAFDNVLRDCEIEAEG